ncbi:LuxR C-terminal-related transcriptional regulator [Streptomyces sp. NPDC015232]|uniref:LuxR C-terminal-related transcriptional regulator n=1 Tax=unclassified Streptomyces TaxID=2593676 RepID=UPI0036F8D7E5
MAAARPLRAHPARTAARPGPPGPVGLGRGGSGADRLTPGRHAVVRARSLRAQGPGRVRAGRPGRREHGAGRRDEDPGEREADEQRSAVHVQVGRRDGGADGTAHRGILVLTTYDLDRYVYAALRAGASGFLLKDVTPEHLAAAVRLVREGDALLAPSITRRLVERFASPAADPATSPVHGDLAALTPREREVLQALARGRSNAEFAARFQLSEATVKTHVARILSKLRLRDRAQAVVVAYETGLVAPGSGAGPAER